MHGAATRCECFPQLASAGGQPAAAWTDRQQPTGSHVEREWQLAWGRLGHVLKADLHTNHHLVIPRVLQGAVSIFLWTQQQGGSIC